MTGGYAFLTPKGLRSEAQGWPRFLRPTLGTLGCAEPTLKGLRTKSAMRNPFRVGHEANRLPRVGRKKTRPTLGFAT